MSICPITQQPFVDPVITSDGHTYERSAIQQWFDTGKRTSPVTGALLPNTTLIPNHALRSALPPSPPKEVPTVILQKNNTGHARLVLTPLKTTVSILLVIDVSSSMNDPVGKQGSESSKFTRLELVQHSALSIVKMLEDNDKIAIITFSNDAKLCLNWTNDKTMARDCINSLRAIGGTNLWDGIELAYQNTVDYTDIIVLTDGEPSYSPPLGYVPNMKRVVVRQNATLSLCGFGYQMDTMLLAELATEGGGMFNFIPDGSMIGTVFVHMIANMKHILLRKVKVNDTVFIGDISLIRTVPLDTTKITSCGQEIAFTVEEGVEFTIPIPIAGLLKEIIHDGMLGRESTDKLMGYYATLPDCPLKDDIFSLSVDKGQLCKAINAWGTWGYPYFVATYFAHEHEIKMNFKDASMLVYSNPALEAFIANGQVIFESLPPPRGAVVREQTRGAGSQATVCMSELSVSCFGGDTEVMMHDGTFSRMVDLRKGMILNGGFTITCVVEYPNQSQVYKIAETLYLTAWHPYNEGKGWRFPSLEPNHLLVNRVFNLVLDQGHYVTTHGGITAVTLGHGMTDSPVVVHPYYGTSTCVDDLTVLPGYEEGHVTVTRVTRGLNGLVCWSG